MNCTICAKSNVPGATVCASCGSQLPTAAAGAGNAADGNAAAYSPSLRAGTKLQDGKFAVGKVMGQGGFGITYKGGDMQLRRYVAVKEFFPAGAQRASQTVQPTGGMTPADYDNVKTKFIEEARTLAKFNHPGIVRVFAVFEENNTAYMVMEFLEGKTLQQVLDEKKTISEAEAIGCVEKVGAALAAVHAARMIHRDIKPDNIVLTNDNRAVLIDFGTARAFANGKTVKQTAMLTPGYAPLEQYGQAARFGPYSDIYSLGATLYHCLTGKVPPQATDRAVGVNLEAPDVANPYVGRTVSDAVMWAMRPKADERPQNVQSFIDALKGIGTVPRTSGAVSPAPNAPYPPQGPAAGQPTPGAYPPRPVPAAAGQQQQWQQPQQQWPPQQQMQPWQQPEPPIPYPEAPPQYPYPQQAYAIENPAQYSGLGSASSPLPLELQGGNWGAFLLCFFWGFSNGTYWASLVCLVPYVGWIMPFIAGAKGNEWAWQNRKWQSIEHFKQTQKAWRNWGIGLFVGSTVVFVLIAILAAAS